MTENDFVFLQETHSPSQDKQKLKSDFNGLLFLGKEKAILAVWQSTIVEQELLKM